MLWSHGYRPPMQRSVYGFLLCAVVASACGEKAPKQAVDGTTPSAPVGQAAEPPAGPVEPATVIATVQLPSGSDPGDIARAVDAVQPGAGALIGAQLPAMLQEMAGVDLAGADLSKPVSIVVVDPKRFPTPFALLVSARDASQLQAAAKQASRGYRAQGGRVLLGTTDVVPAVEAFAFGKLGAAPAQPTAIIHVRTLAGLYQAEIEMVAAQLHAMMAGQTGGVPLAGLADSYVGLFRALVAQTDRIDVTIGARASTADLLLDIHPVADTTLAAFTAAQAPSQHSLIGKLPPSDKVTVAMSGTLRAGAAADALRDVMRMWMSAMYGNAATGEQLDKPMSAWLAAFDGEYAVVMPSVNEGMKMWMLMGTTDAAATRTSWREMMTVFAGKEKAGRKVEVMGMKQTHKFQPAAIKKGKTPIDRYVVKTDLASLPPEARATFQKIGAEMVSHLAVLPKYAAMTMGDKDGKVIRKLIDAASKSGSGKLAAAFQAAVDDSRERQESMVMFMNLAELGPSAQLPVRSVSLGLGKHDSALGVRISVAGAPSASP